MTIEMDSAALFNGTPRLADIVQQGRKAQEREHGHAFFKAAVHILIALQFQIPAILLHASQRLIQESGRAQAVLKKRMLMGGALLDPVHTCDIRQQPGKQTRIKKSAQGRFTVRGMQDHKKFPLDALAGAAHYQGTVAVNTSKRQGFNRARQLPRKPESAQHAQGIVFKGLLRTHAQTSGIKIGLSSERVYQAAAGRMQRKGHGIDREIALFQIIDNVGTAHAREISRQPDAALAEYDALLIDVPGNDFSPLGTRKSRDQVIKPGAERKIKIMRSLVAEKRLPDRTAHNIHRRALRLC
jgi:hypothetical protein